MYDWDMHPSVEPMSFWQLVENSPEWVAAFASIVFGLATTAVIVWQVFVMKAQVRVMEWQTRSAARHERLQNRLIRLQHEHEWVRQKNQERGEFLKLARKLHLVAGCLKKTPAEDDRHHWGELQDTVYELHERLQILDLSVYSTPYDGCFFYPEGLRGGSAESCDRRRTLRQHLRPESIHQNSVEGCGRPPQPHQDFSRP
jgi:hypothetical protein